MTAPSPDTLVQMRALWEGSPELSAAKIGARLGVTANTVIGSADRGKWKRRGVQRVAKRKPPKPYARVAGRIEPTTIFDRLDALNATLDRVLAQTRPWVEDRKPMMVVVA